MISIIFDREMLKTSLERLCSHENCQLLWEEEKQDRVIQRGYIGLCNHNYIDGGKLGVSNSR